MGLQIAAFVVIILSALGGGFLARYFARDYLKALVAGENPDAATTRANAAAGGFLLGAGLLHFLPDAQEQFAEADLGFHFPLSYSICALGFLTILLVERVMFDPEAHEKELQGGKSTAPILLVTLSAHSLLAGVAIGGEVSAYTLVVVALALAVHKAAAAFTLGSSLVRAGKNIKSYYKIIGGFSLATPIGMILGSVLETVVSGNTATVVQGIFQSLAAGSFIYIAALDVIHEEFFHKRASWLELVLFTAALVIMGLLVLVE
jgi:zinc transporter 1/2/3